MSAVHSGLPTKVRLGIEDDTPALVEATAKKRALQEPEANVAKAARVGARSYPLSPPSRPSEAPSAEPYAPSAEAADVSDVPVLDIFGGNTPKLMQLRGEQV